MRQHIGNFPNDLERVLSFSKSLEILIVMSDLNSKIRKGQQKNILGKHGLGVWNDRGDRLAMFYLGKQLVITNTF